MFETSAELISVTYTGELGRMQRTEGKFAILCAVKSVDRAEYYAAYNSGFKPEYRVITDPVNYAGEGMIDLSLPEGVVRFDIYRTYRKSADEIELWCVRKNPAAEQTFTLWTAGKRVMLYGAYLAGTDGAERTETGKVSTSTVTLILPQTLQAYCGETQVAYCRPKAYKAMTAQQQAGYFYIDTSCFFALGEIPMPAADVTEKYQSVNALYDDVYMVQSVNRQNRGKPDTEYIEVIGR